MEESFLIQIHAFELRIKMARPPPAGKGHSSFRAHCGFSSLLVQSSLCVVTLWHPPAPRPILLLSLPTRGWSREFCLISSLHTTVFLRVCFLGKPAATLPQMSPPSRIFEIERVFLTFVLSCLPSAASPQHMLLLVTAPFVADSFPGTTMLL